MRGESKSRKEMLKLSGRYRLIVLNNGSEVQTEQPPDLAVEIHFASQDTGTEQRAWMYFEHFSR